LLDQREDREAAMRGFRWPRLDHFNWALDVFDAQARDNPALALHLVDGAGGEIRISFEELRRRSNRVANWLRAQGLKRGDVLLLMLDNVPALWDVLLATIKLGVIVIPASTLLSRHDLAERLQRGGVRAVVAGVGLAERFAGLDVALRVGVGGPVPGWLDLVEADGADAEFHADGVTHADDPLLLYFTSGTTARPKLVEHSHQSYPVGHLGTMYWIGLQPGDVHLNVSSPGWGKHAWSSVFAPWNAGATVFVHRSERFSATALLDAIVAGGVTSICAPPTVWRLLIQQPLERWRTALRSAVSAGEPLNPEVIERVRSAWGLTLRDGYGQTETAALIGNPPGQPCAPGSMGWPLPGYRIELLDAQGQPAKEGEIALRGDPWPTGLMRGYRDDPERTQAVLGGSHYRTGDVARVDEAGRYWYVGRADDVFKSSDYRISPFELESMLIEHPAVVEAAVVPSPDSLRLAVPKAYVVLADGLEPDAAIAGELFAFVRRRMAPYQRVRIIEFTALPKTLSGKIRRVELRADAARKAGAQCPGVFHEAGSEPAG
jgi:Acyl-coenzyme A synthetases/AMP-(fatty) acid ligases